MQILPPPHPRPVPTAPPKIIPLPTQPHQHITSHLPSMKTVPTYLALHYQHFLPPFSYQVNQLPLHRPNLRIRKRRFLMTMTVVASAVKSARNIYLNTALTIFHLAMDINRYVIKQRLVHPPLLPPLPIQPPLNVHLPLPILTQTNVRKLSTLSTKMVVRTTVTSRYAV